MGCLPESTVGGKKKRKNEIEIFPNPATGDEINVKIAGSNHEQSFVSILDVNGRLHRRTVLGDDLKVSLRGLDKGLYLIQVEYRAEQRDMLFVEKIVIE